MPRVQNSVWSFNRVYSLCGPQGSREPLCPGRDEVERRHLPLKRFVFGVMNILNDPVCAGPTPPGVKVLEKGQCYACDAFGVSNLTN